MYLIWAANSAAIGCPGDGAEIDGTGTVIVDEDKVCVGGSKSPSSGICSICRKWWHGDLEAGQEAIMAVASMSTER